MIREHRADLPDAVTQTDHEVKPVARERVEVLGAAARDIDPALGEHPHRVGVKRFGGAAGADAHPPRRWRAAGSAPLRSASARCSRCTETAPAPLSPAHQVRGRGWLSEPQPRVQGGARPGQQLTAAIEIEHVIGVAPVRRAATTQHHPLCPQAREVVRDQALRLGDQRAQLPDTPIAVRELANQPPPHRMRHQRQKARRRGAAIDVDPLHRPESTSIQIDAISRVEIGDVMRNLSVSDSNACRQFVEQK